METVYLTIILGLLIGMVLLIICYARDITKEIDWWSRECNRAYHRGYRDALETVEDIILMEDWDE